MRVKLAVYVDLDNTPGVMHSAESARNTVAAIINDRISHYNPVVSIEQYDTTKGR